MESKCFNYRVIRYFQRDFVHKVQNPNLFLVVFNYTTWRYNLYSTLLEAHKVSMTNSIHFVTEIVTNVICDNEMFSSSNMASLFSHITLWNLLHIFKNSPYIFIFLILPNFSNTVTLSIILSELTLSILLSSKHL